MGHHIDFLPIGEKNCGESIAIALGDVTSSNRQDKSVILIDGGYKESGEDVATFINDHYDTDYIDLVVSTHPDADHINGLSHVLETMRVGQLWMHRPWLHSHEMKGLRSANFASNKLSGKLEKALSAASDLEAIALAKDIPIIEPFTGEASFETTHGRISILGPNRQYYEQQLQALLSGEAPSVRSSLLNSIRNALSRFESHTIELLSNGGTVSPQNNTSTVLLLETDTGKRVLFTGDAGEEALSNAHDIMVANHDHGPGTIDLIQVPHHGSRQNVGPDILDKLLGQRTAEKDTQIGHAVVSVSKEECPHSHPKRLVTNAFKRRGYPVTATKGRGLLYSNPEDWRENFGPVDSIPHFDTVEAEV